MDVQKEIGDLHEELGAIRRQLLHVKIMLATFMVLAGMMFTKPNPASIVNAVGITALVVVVLLFLGYVGLFLFERLVQWKLGSNTSDERLQSYIDEALVAEGETDGEEGQEDTTEDANHVD